MHAIHKKIVIHEQQKPVAVQIDYGDWLEIERPLGIGEEKPKIVDLNRFRGVLHLTEDPLAYQRR